MLICYSANEKCSHIWRESSPDSDSYLRCLEQGIRFGNCSFFFGLQPCSRAYVKIDHFVVSRRLPHALRTGQHTPFCRFSHCDFPVYLGVTLDRILSYKQHIEKVKGKVRTSNNLLHKQLGLFSINGERAYSLFMTNFGHADNYSTFAPCVKSMAAGFDRKIHNFPHGRLPFKFVRQIFVT